MLKYSQKINEYIWNLSTHFILVLSKTGQKIVHSHILLLLLECRIEQNDDRMCISSLMVDIFVGEQPKICRHHSVVFITTLEIEHRYIAFSTQNTVCLTKLLEKLVALICNTINYFFIAWASLHKHIPWRIIIIIIASSIT